MGNFFKDVWDDFRDGVSDFWDDLKEGDILGAIEGALKTTLNVMTGGLYSMAKTAIDSFLEMPSPEMDFKDRKIMARDASGLRSIIYGQARTGGQLVFLESSGPDDEYLHLIVVFAAHPCYGITEIYFNDDLALLGTTPVGEFAGVLEASIQLGDQVAADPVAVANAPSWTDVHLLLGQTYGYFKLKFDKEVYGSGIPRITATILGKPDIYDPRVGTSGYTDNQALCVLDYLRWSRGFNMPDSSIDMDSFSAAASVCDEVVPSGPSAYEKRYTLNGTMKFNTAPLENIGSMLRAGAAWLSYSQGVWSIVPGKYAAPVLALDESDLIGQVDFAPGSGKNARLNVAKGTYISPLHSYEPVDFVQIAVDGYIADDKEELVADLQMPFTNSGTMARRLAKIAIEQSRFGLGVEASFKYRALAASVGDRITLTIERLGWSAKVFRVEKIEFGLSSGVKLSLREDSPDIYDWTEGEALVTDVPPAVNLPNPYIVSAPSGLSVSEELYSTSVKAQIKARVILSWSGSASAVGFDIQYNHLGAGWVDVATGWRNDSIRIDDFQPGQTQFRVRAINGLGRESQWSSILDYDVKGKTVLPPDVEKMYVADSVLGWEYSPPDDLAGFEVRYHAGIRTTWVDAVPLHSGVITATTYNVANLTSGQKTFLVKAVDTAGNYSESPGFVIFGLGDPVLENIFRNVSYFGLGFPGTIAGGAIDGNGWVVADQVGTFYNPLGSTAFYDQTPGTDFYEDEYLQLVYDFDFTPQAADLPGSAAVNFNIIGENSRVELDYQGNGVFTQFSGKISNLEIKTYSFRIVVPSQFAANAPRVEEVEVVVDVPDITETLNDVAISAAGTRLPITESYRAIKAVTITLQDAATSAVTAKLVDRDPVNGPLVKTYDSAGTAVAGSIDAIIGGY